MTNTPFLASLPPDSVDPVQANLIQSIETLAMIQSITGWVVVLLVAAGLLLMAKVLTEQEMKRLEEQV